MKPGLITPPPVRRRYFKDIARLVAPISPKEFRSIALRGLPVIITGYAPGRYDRSKTCKVSSGVSRWIWIQI